MRSIWYSLGYVLSLYGDLRLCLVVAFPLFYRAQALSTNRSLTSLRLAGNDIGRTGQQGLMALAEGLRANRLITSLDLSGNPLLGPAGLPMWAQPRPAQQPTSGLPPPAAPADGCAGVFGGSRLVGVIALSSALKTSCVSRLMYVRPPARPLTVRSSSRPPVRPSSCSPVGPSARPSVFLLARRPVRPSVRGKVAEVS